MVITQEPEIILKKKNNGHISIPPICQSRKLILIAKKSYFSLKESI